MNRVIYSPSIEYKKEAEELAVQIGLPIIFGDNEHTKLLNFNRDEVQVLFIPKEKKLDHLKPARKLFACPIGYSNDWVEFNETTVCHASMDQDEFFPKLSYMEQHYVKFIARFPKSGKWKIKIVHENKIVDESEVNVS
jgi:hypothetical protein